MRLRSSPAILRRGEFVLLPVSESLCMVDVFANSAASEDSALVGEIRSVDCAMVSGVKAACVAIVALRIDRCLESLVNSWR